MTVPDAWDECGGCGHDRDDHPPALHRRRLPVAVPLCRVPRGGRRVKDDDREDHIPTFVVREPSSDPEQDRHDCLFCGAYVNTECARCGALIMSMIPGNDAFNGCMDVCYRCELEFTDGIAA